jgi:hypothetical protein
MTNGETVSIVIAIASLIVAGIIARMAPMAADKPSSDTLSYNALNDLARSANAPNFQTETLPPAP